MKTILIADDHTIVRLGVLCIVRQLFPQASTAEADSLEQTIRHLEACPVDLLVLDINIPGGNSLQMIEAVRLRQPNIKILMFSAYEEQLFALNYIRAGADGYLTKYCAEGEMKTAFRTVMNGEKYISAAVKDQLLSWQLQYNVPASENVLNILSAREREVLNLLIKGHGVAKIAAMLQLRITTVSTYKGRIFEKMGTSSIVELAEMVKLCASAVTH